MSIGSAAWETKVTLPITQTIGKILHENMFSMSLILKPLLIPHRYYETAGRS